MWILSLLISCSDEPPTDGSPLVADVAPTPDVEVESVSESPTPEVDGNVITLDDWEMAIIGPQLDELRTGVQLSGPDPIGICRASTETRSE